MNTIKLEFTLDQLNVVMASLGKMPYESVFPLVELIRTQAGPQVEAQQKADAPAAE